MRKYNCTICGVGCYSADTTKTICAECETDKNLVEVVRCKDCKYKDTEDCPATERRMCRNNIGVIKEFLETWCGMEFCSNGKRRAE